jgi:hypothetical protein
MIRGWRESQVERTIKCSNEHCPETVRVSGSSEPSLETPEIFLNVQCPSCGTHNVVKWAAGIKYDTSLADSSK